jgi:DNA repair photolyase
MKPGPVRRYVDELVEKLLEPLIRQSHSALWKLVGWDAEQGISVTLQKGDAVVLVEFEPRSERKKCYARTGRFNVVARRPFEAGRELNTADRAAVDELVSMVDQREGMLPRLERPTTSRKRSIREILVDKVLVPEGRGHYYINPYAGCMIGCPFCYVAERADMSRGIEGLPFLEWGRYVDVKVNAADILKEEVKQHPPGIVRLSPILTDPYQPVERRFRVTRQCLEILLDAGFDVAVLTRSAVVLEDLELLTRFRRALVGFSVPSDQDRYRLVFEPGADPIEERIEALSICHQAGLFTAAFIQPVLPMDVDALVGRLVPVVRTVRIDRMDITDSVLEIYQQHGLMEAASDAFFTETIRRLEVAFSSRGVVVDQMDDISGLIRGRG